MSVEARLTRNKKSLGGRISRATIWHVVVIVGVLILIYPIIWLVTSSFKRPDEILTDLSLLPKHFTINNYTQGWTGTSGSTFASFFLNSLLISGLAVLGNVVACSLTGFALTRLRFRGRGVFFALMIGTLLLPYHVLIVPQYVVFQHLGWINTILPLVVPKFLATDAFFVFLMSQFLRGIPRDIDEAARLDGANSWQLYWRVILPLARPALVTTSIFTFVWTWNDFFSQLIYLNQPSQYTVPLGLRLFVDETSHTAFGPLFAMSVISLLPIFLFFLAFQRLLVEGIATSGLKG